jgi:hypothetical protein
MTAEREPVTVLPAVLSELFAVVLVSDAFGAVRVKWNGETSSWMMSSPYGPGFVYQPSQNDEKTYRREILAPNVDDVRAAADLATSLKKARQCFHCGEPDPVLHAIVTDVHGDPTLACLGRPDPVVVESFGGGGNKKHYGGPLGCHAVKGSEIRRRNSYILQAGHHLYGEPLTTFQSIERDWCGRCMGTAHNIREHHRGLLRSGLDREPTAAEIRKAVEEYERRRIEGARIRYLLDEIDGRSPRQLLLELRAGMSGLTPEEYAAKENERGW